MQKTAPECAIVGRWYHTVKEKSVRRKIEQLLNGKFEYERATLVLSVERIDRQTDRAGILSGDFKIGGPEEKKVRGFLYSSNPRVTFDPSQFYGQETRISYQVDMSGIAPGESTEGFFTLCTDLGEYSLPYSFRVKGREERAGEQADPVSVEELADLAHTDIHRARTLFADPTFGEGLRRTDREAYMLYEGVRKNEQPQQGLEEFLIGCHKKEPVDLSLETNEVSIAAPARSSMQTVLIHASCPGWLNIEAASDSRFLRLEKKQFTTDEFVAGEYALSYIIDTNFLHAGMNYARISVSTCYQTLYLDVRVDNCVHRDQTSAHRVRKLMQKKLLSLYLDLRMKRIEMQSWIDRSQNVLTGYRRAGGEDVFADLFQAQLYFADGKNAKGRRLLGEIEAAPERFERTEQYAFYLYITTFFERDAVYVDQVEARIQQMLLDHRDNWIIQWILLYLDERYLKDDSARLDAILGQLQMGCSSPIMYLEACQVLRKNPYLMRKLDNTMARVLLFASRESILTEELAFHTANLALQEPFYERKMQRVLEACYELSESREILSAVCACLIAGDRKGEECFRWYALGVDQQLRITGLYEYYMETMQTTGIEKMPQVIRMYFAYNNSLSYHRKAAIYRNISDNRDNVPQVYRTSRPDMEHFVATQLSMGRIDENLAVLYERFLTRRMLTPALAQRLVQLLFTFEVICKNPKMKSVLVIHDMVKAPQEIPLKKGKALIRVYSEHVRILLLDDKGVRYAASNLYRVTRYMSSPLLLTYCRELIPEHEGLVLFYTGRGTEVNENTLSFYKQAEKMESLTDEFRREARKKILDYYMAHPRQEDLYEYLTGIDRPSFIEAGKSELMMLFTREGMYEQAFDLLQTYGAEQVDVSCLVRICSQSVLACEYEENPVLLDYCFQCFQYGKYDDNILTYLLMYYDGPIEEMKRLWNTGYQNELDTMVLEEKILTLLIFTGTGSEGTERIFASYQSRLGRKKLCRAYLNLKAYEYFVKNLPVADLVFEHLEGSYEGGEEMEDVCLLALLQYFSGLPELSEKRREMVTQLLAAYNSRGMRFAFFRKFPEKLRISCQLEDKVFLEYVTNPAHTVHLIYRMKGQEEWQKESMKNCFEGIFVKEFILFEGESIECWMEEYDQDHLIKQTAKRSLYAAEPEECPTSRYALLCRMSRAASEGRMDELAAELDNYYLTDYLTRELFSLIG